MSQSAVVFPFAELPSALLSELEIGPRARLVAASVAEVIPDCAVVVFTIEEPAAPVWTARATAGEIVVDGGAIPLESGTLGAVAEERTILQFRVDELSREDFAHLDVRQNIAALSYVPLLWGERVMGCIEIVSFAAPPSEDVLEQIGEMGGVAAIAFAGSLAYAAERNAGLASVMRLTQLYDIEKVFNATLEMASLLPIICEKVSDLIHAAAVNLWMVEREELLLLQQAGDDPGAQTGERQTGASGGIAGQVSETGEPVLLQAEDEALVQRNARAGELRVGSLLAAPLMDGESLVGVLEVVRLEGESPLDDDDLFVLTQVAASAAQALHNSSLLEAERKIEILQTLVSVGQEIGSTLNLERVLQAIVNQPQLVIPYERAAIALEQRGRLTIQAVSGVRKIDAGDPAIQQLTDVLRWTAGLQTEIQVSRHDEEIDDPRPETREKFRRYFDATGSRGFYAIPLTDEEGSLGVLSFESPDPDFLTDLHIEVIKILASQATLALRNASLYKEVPFIGILEPLIEKKRRFMALDRSRRALRIGILAAVVLVLVLAPIPLRVAGTAQVAPDQTQYVRAEEDGVVQKVFVHEGDRVTPGMPLAQMADWNQRAVLATLEARYNTAMAQGAQALVNNNATVAGQRQLEANYLRSELARAAEELSRMTLRAQLSGVVATPYVEDLAGRKVSLGDPLMELVSTNSVSVDVAVPEGDVGLLRVGDAARVKLESYPARTFSGRVGVVSPASQVSGDERTFYARIAVPNPEGRLRAGMQGYGKIRTGLRPLGYVLFREPALWMWSKLWGWFGW
ncbi:MAG TPA: GAF domain-containing protein [Acidobacteriaceae bacterium]|nr:GAF domain-containing protein [Acidobacteriaceae bacterium]